MNKANDPRVLPLGKVLFDIAEVVETLVPVDDGDTREKIRAAIVSLYDALGTGQKVSR